MQSKDDLSNNSNLVLTKFILGRYTSFDYISKHIDYIACVVSNYFVVKSFDTLVMMCGIRHYHQ